MFINTDRFLTATFLLISNESTVSGGRMTCVYLTRSYNDAEPTFYTCQPVNTQTIFNGSRISIGCVDGQHAFGKYNDDVKAIYFGSVPNLGFFPQNINKIFKNLNLIIIYNSPMIEITKDDLKPFKNLKYFYLMATGVKIIQENLFLYNPDLLTVWLYNSQITHIHPNALVGLNSLYVLRLDLNSCRTSFGC